MKKNNIVFVLGLLVAAASCSKKSPETLISRWEKKVNEVNVVERKLASGPQGQCLKDIFTVDTLKQEMKELERQFTPGLKVSGTWKHLDLSRLPIPQANFLRTYGNQIGDLKSDSIDYSLCDDVPCIINKIYGKDDYVAGYVHYLWYLKFGHLLSADNRAPEQTSKNAGEYNGKVHSLDKYLYDHKELYGLWRLSLMLKPPHSNLKFLKEVQRIPRGERFEGKEYAAACGLAFSGGWIMLADGCLTVNHWNMDTGYLYQAVTHELTHHVDFEQGRGSKGFYRSHKQDYLDLAGMYLNEFVDSNGTTQRKWEHRPGIKLVTGYAGTAPQENFAESLSVFRVDGDLTKKNITQDHFNFVSRDYYNGRSFEKEANLRTWIQDYSSDTGKAVFKSVIDCSKDPGTVKSTYFKAADFSTPVLPTMLNCLSARAEEISRSIRAKASLYEPDGCLTLNDNTAKGRWEIHMKDHLKKSFERYLQELRKDKEYLARIQEFYAQLADKTIARASYINCFGEREEEKCFSQELQRNAYEKALSLNLPEEQTKEMADMYISYHAYSDIRNETLKHYQVFVSSNMESIRRQARSTWEGCFNIPQDDDQSPSGTLFMISNGYLITSFYNCLNANIPDAIKEIVRNFSIDGLKLQHAKEEVILSQEVQPHLVKILRDIYGSEQAKERRMAQELIAEDKGEIRKQILSDFDWVKNVVDTNQIISDCKRAGLSLISMKPYYNLKFDLFNEYLEKNTCFNISSTPQFNSWLETSQDTFNQKVVEGLELKLIELGNLRAQECLKQFPIDTVVNKVRFRKQREACLVDEWPKLETQVLTNAMKDPMVIKFKMSAEVLRVKMEGSRRRLQLRLIKEHFN